MKIYSENNLVKSSVKAFLKDRTPYQKERLHSSLNQAGIGLRIDRSRLIEEYSTNNKFKLENDEGDKPYCFICDLKVDPVANNKCQFCGGDLP